MKLTIADRIARKSVQWTQQVKSVIRGCIETRFLGERVKFARGSSIPCGSFSLPASSHRNRLVRDSDYVQQLALAAHLEATPECRLFVDVGAFHGYYAISAGKYLANRRGKVLAIEPDPENFEKLTRSVELNGLEDTVVCLKLGCSDHCGTMSFMPGDSQGRLSHDNAPEGMSVEVKTLDAILDSLHIDQPIDCLMVDVEGAELPVLRGLRPDRRAKAKMFIEMHPYAWEAFGYTPQEFDEYLQSQSLCCVDMFHRVHQDFRSDPWSPQYIGPTTLVAIDRFKNPMGYCDE